MRFSIACFGLALLTAGCGRAPDGLVTKHSCTSAGCESGVVITLTDAPEQATHYQVRVTYGGKADAVAIQCSFDMPGVRSHSAADDDGGSPNPYDDPNPELHGCEQVSGTKTWIEFSLEPSPFLLGPSAAPGSTVTLYFRDAPDSMRVGVIRGSEALHTDAFKPEYEELDPNGPECGPHCRQATHDIHLR